MERPLGIILTAIVVALLGALPPTIAAVHLARSYQQHQPRKTAAERRREREGCKEQADGGYTAGCR